jgi:hypothetical protein
VKTFATILLALAAGCGGPGAASPEGGNINTAEQINKTKCGACHSPFDPGGHTKDELGPILDKHKSEKRATLSDDDWTKLQDYLAKK